MGYWQKGWKSSCMAVCVVAVVFASGCESGSGGGGASGRFDLSFVAAGASEQFIADLLEQSDVMGIIVRGMNDVFALPSDINIVFRPTASGQEIEGPFYRPSTQTIEFPYSFFALTTVLLQAMNPNDSDEELLVGAMEVTVFLLFHEVAHSMIDVLDIPVVGREEDAADGLAAALLSLQPDTVPFLLTTASFFDGLAVLQGGGDITAAQFADEHSLSQQRYYQLLCWVYGTDPGRFGALVSSGYLPEERAVRCQGEASQNLDSWMTLLGDHVK